MNQVFEKSNINNAPDSNIESIRTSELQINEKDLKCAPNVSFSSGSCISLEMLVKMAFAYNKHNPNNPIKLNDTVQIMSPTKYKKYLVKQFKNRLSSCDDQKCWTEQDFMKYMDIKLKKDLSKNIFRPTGPVNDNEEKNVWLNTTNIDEVMQQYENLYPDFFYLGTVPIDFEKLDYYKFKGIDFGKYIKNDKKKMGAVFNLDESSMSGSHWVGLFINFNSGEICFSDSYGTNPEKRIIDFMKKVAKYMKDELHIKPLIKINRKRHQFKGSACGVYSLNFILRLLKGDTFEEITAKRIPDDEVDKCRSVYFRKKDKKKKTKND